MTKRSAMPLAASLAAAPYPSAANRELILVAWLATLMLSKLPLVIARDVFHTDLPWITSAWIVTAVLLFAGTYALPFLKPLRNYFLVIGVIYLMAGLDPFVRQTAVWKSLFVGQSEMVAVFADRILLILGTFIVIAALFLAGVKRRDIFLSVGNLKAPVGGQASPARKWILTWPLLGTVMSLLLGGLFFMFLVSQNPAILSEPAALLPWLPLILLSAAMNAFGEEVTYRASTLGTLLPVVGPKHALWLTSLWFGLGHYYGGFPSGPAGLVQSGLLGLLMGKAMLDTRGLGWPWFIHVTIDTAIYTFIALTAAVAV